MKCTAVAVFSPAGIWSCAVALLVTAAVLAVPTDVEAQSPVKPATTPAAAAKAKRPAVAAPPSGPAATAPGPAPGQQAPASPATDTVTKAGVSYQVGPAPAWVVPVAPPAAPPAVEAAAMHYRVIDEQVRVEGRSMAEYSRVVRVVNQVAGLSTAAQFQLEFDPSYQTLTLHKLEAVRGGQRIDKLDRRRIEVLQREKQLEQRMYDGRATLSIVLDDVRVGDEIEITYTTTGLNPVFDGQFVHTAWMSSHRGPVQQYQVRLLAPAARAIQFRKGPADASMDRTEQAGWVETVFRRQSVPMMQPEAGMASGAFLDDQLQFSEFADWAAVARWGDKLFKPMEAGPLVAQRAAEVAAAKSSRSERVAEALRIVQQDVRYFGVEVGVSTHRPHPPEQVLQQRFGDCKDKVTLLAAILQRLDVPVQPVLVSTRLRGDVSRMLPSPLAFDHVIARVDMDGSPRYLDPTRTHQTGSLDARQSIGLGRGLALTADTTALVPLPAAQGQLRLQVEDRIRVENFSATPTLESRVTYRGDLAEMMREAAATQGLTPIVDALTQAYVRAYPRIKRTAPASLQPVEGDDAVSIVQRFEVPEFWRFPEQRLLVADIVNWGPVDWLIPPKTESRRHALAFAFPGVYKHRVQVDFAEDVFAQPGSRRVDEGDSHFKLQLQAESTLNRAVFDAQVSIDADQVRPEQWASFSASLNKALPRLGNSLSLPAFSKAAGTELQARIKQLDDDLKRGRLKALTREQGQSHFKVAVLDTQIGGGRLSDLLKAEALVARGVALDHLGRLSDGQRDFEAALALAPTNPEALQAAAVNANSRGDSDRAVALTSQLLQAQPRDAQALHLRAMAHYLAGRYDPARQDWDAALQDRTTVRRGYALLWRALLARREGAEKLAALAKQYPRDDWPTEWPRPVLDTLLGSSDDDSLLKAARQSKTPLEAQTEAYFYLGEKLHIEGDASRATREWKRAVDLGVVEYVEFNAAQRRLAAQR